MKQKFSKPYEGWVTAWRYNDFFQAKIKLSLLYTLLIGGILLVFSLLLNVEVEKKWHVTEGIIPEQQIVQNLPKEFLSKTIEEIKKDEKNKRLYYELYFTDQTEIKIDAHTGKIFATEHLDGPHPEEFLEEFVKILFYLNSGILFFVAILSYFLAGITLAPIRKKMEQQKKFTADVAHELRNPLTAMQACSESILRQPHITEKDTREILTDILEEAKKLSLMTDDLLILVNNEKKTTQFTNIDYSKILTHVIEKVSALAEEKDIIIHTDIKPWKYKGNALMLEKVFFNLLQNAIKFSYKQGTINVTLSSEGVFSIQDFGHGIEKKHLPHIFERFYKADNARDMNVGGSGLGLSIVQEFVALHGGKIEVKSTPQKGSTFTIFFL